MRPLEAARETCESFLPGLLDRLADVPLAELEAPGSPAISHFRQCGGPALVIPKEHGGFGADPLQAMAVTRALASQAPSLAVATTMHHFSVATLFSLAASVQSSGLEWALLEGVAEQGLLVASGFAEGRPGQGILSPTMTARKTEGGYLINGSKKPCSLSRSMDLLTASVALPATDGTTQMAVLLIPRQTEGLDLHPFWASQALAGAESDEVRLTDVFVDEQLMMPNTAGPGELDELQTVGLIWFELLISSCYLGMVSGLVERVVDRCRGSEPDRARALIRLEAAAQLLEGVARRVRDGEVGNEGLAQALVARYAAQDALGDARNQAVELLGGTAFMTTSDVAVLAAASHGIGFHPPSRSSFTRPYLAHAAGEPLRLA
ncbi:acyl-CoA/acyl-ACP dehydrogenase [Streptomyces somaliensis]|uniref:acyl-CoA dehydrogenase family protein n=1 Tax=Streptomyces somaliensis TaxID=78355 RepID=UPI0020CD0BB3|nr:acyl-CoA dehydrogenase family protein [Streptomyces somaliensis]MCP9944758.1 acyl-CoA/acyl-ACP dehydrogenase [Streptomyces somaliensis]MCP9962015.1 acyl-CoA/acyl-ACP dehydrogenase [Streptomyces somaliensis]MCP9974835.1 acyl-CoA/acyl-ACP dehydrogenase [Streptomyces somaliensis]